MNERVVKFTIEGEFELTPGECEADIDTPITVLNESIDKGMSTWRKTKVKKIITHYISSRVTTFD